MALMPSILQVRTLTGSRHRHSCDTGSTGKPKGVDVSHGNVTNALLLGPGRLGITVGTKVGHVLNVSFDMGKLLFAWIGTVPFLRSIAGAWEMLGCLMNGGTLCLRISDWTATLHEVCA